MVLDYNNISIPVIITFDNPALLNTVIIVFVIPNLAIK